MSDAGLPFSMLRLVPRLPLVALTLACGLSACEGPMGPRGPAGDAGPRGPAGESADAGSTPVDAALPGDAGQQVDGSQPPRTDLTGSIRDRIGASVAGGRVVLVPTDRVAALSEASIDLSLTPAQAALATNDEPLEDVIDVDGAKLASADVSERGEYRFASVPDGEFFVVYVPAASDDGHLPGGDPARTPRTGDSLRGSVLDLTVSGSPSPSARYVGSSTCIDCHGRHTALASAHANTVRTPGVSSPLQDIGSFPRVNELLSRFEQGTTLYFYGCDKNAAPLPTCRVQSTAPVDLASVSFTMRLERDPALLPGADGAFFVELRSADGLTTKRYPVAVSVGGLLSYQQLVTQVTLPDGSTTHFVLPLSYQLAGNDKNPSYRDFQFAAYRAEDWFDLDHGVLREPPLGQAFERQCAGCHVTGLRLSGSDQAGWHAKAVADRDGIYDLDGDGRKELLAVGCESCHGPGSEHIEQFPRGQHIVSPQLLTPERQTLLCGRCHSNGRGAQAGLAPLDEQGHMPMVGERRSTFLRDHQSALEGTLDALFASGDSRAPRQQYTDFIRSPKYRSTDLLVTCGDCHAPHREPGLGADLRYASNDAAGCQGCHAETSDIHAHANAKVGYDHVARVKPEELSCTACHMVKTGTGGAHVLELVDKSSAPNVVPYFHGDRASHRFGFVDHTHAVEQPVAATRACAFCHVDFLPN